MEEDSGLQWKKIRKYLDEVSKEAARDKTCCVAYVFVNNVGVRRLNPIPLFVGESRPVTWFADRFSRFSSLKISNKYKKFCELAHDVRLPVRAVVEARRWISSLDCSLCGDIETTMHCLKKCRHASAVWSKSWLSTSVVHISSSTFREFLRDATWVLREDIDLSLFVFICWSLWEARNEHEDLCITPNPDATLNKALLLLEQATVTRPLNILQLSTIVELALSRPRTWSPPLKGWLKVNVEALNLEHMMAMGAVVREENGHALVAISACYEPEKDLLNAKARALQRALSFGENDVMLHHQKVLVEVTSSLIVEFLAEFKKLRTLICEDIELCNSLEICLSAASRFSDMKFASVNAQENRLAYCLASKAVLQECEGSRTRFNAPDWLKEAIAADLPN